MSEHVVLSLDGNFFIITVVGEDGKDPAYEARSGKWRSDLTDAAYLSKFSFNSTKCTANAVNAAALNKRWVGHIKFETPLTEQKFKLCLHANSLQERVEEIHARWESDKEVPSDRLDVHPDRPLADYQRVPAIASRLIPGYALYMEQGTGKTAVAIARACTDAAIMRESGETRMYRMIVVCPKNIRSNWKREIERFSTVNTKVTIMRGGKIKRIRELAEAMNQDDDQHMTVLITSYGLLCQAWEECLKFVEWDLSVVDEGHCIKWHETDRTKYCHLLRDRSIRRMELTGTPIVNSALDLYSQFEFLGRGLSGHNSFSAYRDKYGIYARSGDGTRDVFKGVANLPQLKKKLSQVAFIVRKDQVLKDLPEKQYDIMEVEMTKRQLDDYDALASQYYLEIEEDLKNAEESGKREMVINNALVKLMKLAQITSGFLIIPEERDENGDVITSATTIAYDPNPKLDALLECIGQLGEKEKMLVWCCYQYDIKVITTKLRSLGIEFVQYHGQTSDADRTIAENRINRDPTCKVFIGNPEAGGAGLNLLGYVPGENDDLGTNVTWMVYYSQNHKPVGRWQSEDRSHRRGTRVPLRITDLVVPETIDEDIRVRVVDKKKHALDVQDLREILLNLAKRRR